MVQRDGSHNSLWQKHIDTYQTSSKADINTLYDVIVVGGGITGITTALMLQESGKKCLVLEAENIGFGTTGGTTAHLNTLLDTPYTTIQSNFSKEDAQLVATAAAEAIQQVKTNIIRYKISCGFADADAYLFAKNQREEEELADIFEASKEAGLDLVYTETIPLPVDFKKAIKVRGQAKFSPLDYVYGLAKAFEKAGGVILQQTRMNDIKENENMEAETDAGVFRARDLVYATHIPPGVNLLHLRCLPYRSYAMAVTLKTGKYPEGLAYDMEDPYNYYRVQELDGVKYLIVGGKDHKTAHEENAQHLFEELEAMVRDQFEVKDIEARWSSQYFEPADGLPYIGHLPGNPEHIYVATGFGGNGMTYSHVSAKLLTALINHEESPYEKLFDPNRIKPVAGFKNFISHNANVVKEFLGKLVPADKLPSFSELAPGEARVVKYEGQKIGLYKDESGELHAVNPICTHLKCDVKWNTAEHSWDCPCHGARYNYDGKVITGPANADLEKIDILQLVEHK